MNTEKTGDGPAQDSISYYVFDNLDFTEDGQGGRIERLESIDSAIERFRELPDEWTTALGANLGGSRELDLVQRHDGHPVLVTDYRLMPEWNDNPAVQQALSRLVDGLGITLMTDHALVGEPIYVPCELGDKPLDPYFSDKQLVPHAHSAAFAPTTGASQSQDSRLAVINEAYVDGTGWMKAEDLAKFARTSSEEGTGRPTVTMLNVGYRDDSGRHGQMDISPSDLASLHRMTRERDTARDGRDLGQASIAELQEIAREKAASKNRGRVDAQRQDIESTGHDAPLFHASIDELSRDDLMGTFSEVVGEYIQDGWILDWNNTSYSNCEYQCRMIKGDKQHWIVASRDLDFDKDNTMSISLIEGERGDSFFDTKKTLAKSSFTEVGIGRYTPEKPAERSGQAADRQTPKLGDAER